MGRNLTANVGVMPSTREYYQKYDAARREDRAEERRQKYLAKRFVAWDGEGSEVPEGTPQPYMLFGNSDGLSIEAEELTTESCLALILQGDPDVINFGFAFNYDVNQILWNLSTGKMNWLARHGKVKYKGYRIEWVPGKWFQVGRVQGNKKTIKIYDVFHFFNVALVTNDPKNPGALDKYEIGTPEQRAWLADMKKARPQFSWAEIQKVKEYWILEGELMVALMDHIRVLFADAGMYITTWHGPGAVARYMLNGRKVKDAQNDLRKSHPFVWLAARFAFSAGRFEQFRAGLHLGDVWNYDIHSAFPYAIQFLPDLNKGHWEYTRNVDRNAISEYDFAVFQIDYAYSGTDKKFPHPLFRRLVNDNICWPDKVRGWYWAPEASLVKDNPDARFNEAWIFHSDGSKPMAWIADIYDTRERLKSMGNPMEYPFKLGMNSCYGQFAQRAGWQNQKVPGPPRYHQLEWAGYITSMCKRMVYLVAKWCWDRGALVTIDTDAVCSTIRIPNEILPNGIGPRLGQWEESRADGILLWQSGFYWLKKGDDWTKCRTRGAPRGTIPIERAWESLPTLEPIKYDKKMFVGYGMSRQLHLFHKWRSWIARPTEVTFGGRGKRQHLSRACPKCNHENFGMEQSGWNDQLHLLRPMPPYVEHNYWEKTFEQPGDQYWSMKHKLPWVSLDKDDIEEYEDFDEDIDEAIWEDIAL